MPLVFMAGGMLDRMGGVGLPGRCKTVAEARRKIERILVGDQELIDSIRQTQAVLLRPMVPENCEPAWRAGFAQIASNLAELRAEQAMHPGTARKKRIAVVLPVAYRGGSLRGVQMLAHAIHMGSRQSGEAVDVVFLHPDEPFVYSDSDFDSFPKEIKRRPFKWKTLSAEEARRAMLYAGYKNWRPASEHYLIPEDGIRNIQDCDLWIIVSHRMIYPILPLKPVVLMMYDFLQRYIDVIPQRYELMFLSAVRSAERVLVTSEFTRRDALQYAGIESKKIGKVPMLAPEFEIRRAPAGSQSGKDSYFIWTTNSTPHKNHKNSLEALRIYYEEMEGALDCWVTGVNSRNILVDTNAQIDSIAKLFREDRQLKRRVRWMGELPDSSYRKTLAHAKFIWHSGKSDNGTFSVIEGACLNIPALSSDYPAMREIDEQFSLRMAWMDPESPREMAKQLKIMENNIAERKDMLPSEAKLREQSMENHAKKYWQEVRACL
jgi:glycosyltransferase involved in cell wall biosynthesis